MKYLVITILASAISPLFGQAQKKDSLPQKERGPHAIPKAKMLRKKIGAAAGNDIYKLSDGMLCIAPDSGYRS